MHGINHHVKMGILFIIVGYDERLVILPLHVLEKALGSFGHVFAGGFFLQSPVEANVLDCIFGRTATSPHSRLLLQQVRASGSPQHFVDGRGGVIVGEIEGMCPAYTLLRFGLRVMSQIGREPFEGHAGRVDAHDHLAVPLEMMRRISLSKCSNSAGGEPPWV